MEPEVEKGKATEEKNRWGKPGKKGVSSKIRTSKRKAA